MSNTQDTIRDLEIAKRRIQRLDGFAEEAEVIEETISLLKKQQEIIDALLKVGYPEAKDEKPITMNAFESIECAIAFDVRDWSADRRSAWIYAIVFGWDYEDSWDVVAKKYGWDDEDRKRASAMHEQWVKAKGGEVE